MRHQMGHNRIRRASALALALLLATAGIAFADTVPADGDADSVGNQSLVDLGERLPGQIVAHDVAFTLTCAGIAHADPGQTVTIEASSFTAPLDGALAATATTIGPVPAGWTLDGEGCPSPAPRLASNGSSTVTLTMPTTPGDDYVFTVMYARLGANGLTGTTAISFLVDVLGNTPPSLVLPAPMTVEGTTTGGANVAFSAGASDAEDEPDPTPTCSPASGAFFGLGTTTVSCSVTDTGGLSASGTFDVTVEDTTAPTLAGIPGDRSISTSDPAGTTVSWPSPTAIDLVDSDVAVGCSPASGSFFPTGTTTVACGATDDAGNVASASFRVTVSHVPPVTWSVAWGEPIGGAPATLTANHGRTVPIKADILAGGSEVTSGDASLHIEPCGGGAAAVVPLEWSSGRWSAHLDTARLGAGCHVVTAIVDGNEAGAFVLELRGGEAAASKPAKAPAKGRGR